MGEEKYCYYESDSFPAEEFIYDGDRNLIHMAGKKSNWHYASGEKPPILHTLAGDATHIPVMPGKTSNEHTSFGK